MAGELIRILINHPDVDIVTAHAPAMRGRSVSSVHHGLIGELPLLFSDTIDSDRLDIIFIDSHSETAERFRAFSSQKGDGVEDSGEGGLCIVDMSHAPVLDFEALGMIYGLPEINRRRLVHGARRAIVPRSIAGVSLISLLPLATHLLLRGDIRIQVECPDDIGIPDKLDMAVRETEFILSRIQQSFSSKISLERLPSSHSARLLRVMIEVECGVAKDELERIYQETFDDHNFTWLSGRPAGADEVEGTDKCVITLSETGNGKLLIETVADCRMRGGAGDAVHIMNLMFGLHEKTGLSLKAHKY